MVRAAGVGFVMYAAVPSLRHIDGGGPPSGLGRIGTGISSGLAAQNLGDDGHKLTEVTRFCFELIGTERKASLGNVRSTLGGKHHNWNLGETRLSIVPLKEATPTNAWHADIEHDDIRHLRSSVVRIGPRALEIGHGFLRTPCYADMYVPIAAREDRLHEHHMVRVILHNQQPVALRSVRQVPLRHGS